jgi:hypothetical protein
MAWVDQQKPPWGKAEQVICRRRAKPSSTLSPNPSKPRQPPQILNVNRLSLSLRTASFIHSIHSKLYVLFCVCGVQQWKLGLSVTFFFCIYNCICICILSLVPPRLLLSSFFAVYSFLIKRLEIAAQLEPLHTNQQQLYIKYLKPEWETITFSLPHHEQSGRNGNQLFPLKPRA